MSINCLPILAALNYLEIIRNSSLVEISVLVLLGCVSVFSWALIALKMAQLSRARRQSLTFLDTFWKASRLEAIYQNAKSLRVSPLSRVFCAGYEELSRVAQTKEAKEGAMSERLGGIENVERALYRASTSEITQLESKVPFLGTVGEKGNATLSTVAAPVGNALFATAAGLFAAIPAVVAYNAFVSRIRVFDTEMSNFSSDFLNIVKRYFFH